MEYKIPIICGILIILASICIIIGTSYIQKSTDIIQNREFISDCMNEKLYEFRCNDCVGGYEKEIEEKFDIIFEECLQLVKDKQKKEIKSLS